MLWKGFQRPKRLEFDAETLTARFGRFSAQPFERGFGTTIGNALRRVLLSAIEGAAVTSVKIDNVLHEFSPIPGVVEDATDIILNLKQIPIKMHGDETKTLYLRADIPSFSLKAGDAVSVRQRSAKKPAILYAMEEVKGRGIPDWLEFDASTMTGRVAALPTREQINLPVQEQLIVELYSK